MGLAIASRGSRDGVTMEEGEGAMTGGTFTTRIQAPQATVWRLVADLDTHRSWSPKPYTIEWLSGEPNQIGSTFRSVGWIPGDKHHTNEGEITERAEPTRFALKSDDDGDWFINEFDLKPVGDAATEVSFTLTFPKMRGFKAVAAPIVFPLVGKSNIRKRMDMLKDRAEAGTTP
jgi:uncharacterized protein YndB with AHSA1/START domain